MFDRRGILRGIGAATLAWGLPSRASAETDVVGMPLLPWRPGTLDIHHLATGRGDATVIVAPNGHVALIDAGAVLRPDPALVDTSPEAARDPGEWIGRYVLRRLAETSGSRIETALITHLHPDHVGAVLGSEGLPAGRSYQPTGLSRVAEIVPIRTVLDPCYPEFGYPPLEDRASIENYIAFLRNFATKGGNVERLAVGATGQILPGVRADAGFGIRTLAARGYVWTGTGSYSAPVFPPRSRLKPQDVPTENAMSAAILLSFGRFRYFAGGDLTGWADAGTRPWMNALDRAAKRAGKVDVAAMPHHGMFDGTTSIEVGALAARDWIISAWHAAHPSIEALERVFNTRIYPGERDVFATALHPAAELAMGRLIARFKSKRGNVVCRVAGDGASYKIVVTDAIAGGDIVKFASDTRKCTGESAIEFNRSGRRRRSA